MWKQAWAILHWVLTENGHFKVIFTFCYRLQVTGEDSWQESQRGSVPTNVPSSHISSVFSLLSQLLFFATNLHCQLWLSEQLWVMGSANVQHMEKFRIILLSKNTTGCRKSHSAVMNSQRDKRVSKFTSYLTALQQIWVMDPTYSKLLYTARHFPTAWIYTLSMGFLMIAIFFFPIKSSWLHIKKLLVHFETCY